MKRQIACAFLLVVSLSFVRADVKQPDSAPGAPRFSYVDVYLDTGKSSLAAYQFEFTAETGRVTVVGIEGGEHKAFANPPYYDPAALGQHRVILAAFNTGIDLPAGRTRIARIHLMIEGKTPEYVAKLTTAANADGHLISGAALSVSEGAKR